VSFAVWMSYILGLLSGSGGCLLIIIAVLARQRRRLLRHTDPLAGMVKVASGGRGEFSRFRISKDL
jgi:hypothetical protein